MKKFTVTKELDYVQGYLRYGHAEVTVSAETEEEALALANDCFNDGNFSVVVDDYSVEDCGEPVGEATIISNWEE